MDAQKEPIFCPNCGTKLNKKEGFCPNCGFNLTEYFEKQTNKTNEKVAVPQNDQIMTATHKKRVPKWIKILIGIIIVLMAGGYWFGNNYYGKSQQLNRMISSIKHDKNVGSYFYSNDPSLKITNNKMEPFVNMMKNKERLSNFENGLRTSGSAENGFTLKQHGKFWLLFPKYQVLVTSVYANISTNHAGVDMFVNDSKVFTSTSSKQSKKIGPLVPGTYDLKAAGTVGSHKITNENSHDIVYSDQSYDLSLKTVSFNVVGYPESDIYINGKKAGHMGTSGKYKFDEYPWSDGMKVQLRYSLKGSTITSKETPISEDEDGEDVTTEFPDMITKDDADQEISNIFSDVDSISSSGDKSDDLSDYFVNGDSNDDYDQLTEMAKGYYKDDDINSVSYDTKVINVKPSGHDKSDVTYQVKYTFDNSDDDSDDAGEHIQVFEYVATFNKVAAEDDSDNSGFKISSITPGVKVSDRHED
ncbi:zinc ribbon domain-containing protein [Pediococcus claussenii]|uniref:zinc ribbon domain-containing protein n=1 Tax=Pediococcus claussenii TaxID=187452 RepID=UPI00031CB6A4|nr:zinc-ribbon domain-containing protein [Pediococcus claussenii]ANZ69669.1 hypothetical protein AYR57_04780 [Pediococcus claussenii]ANZ71486.1 hypothetical protein AYR58_04785 [Pediococcus claussenii]KRN19845.1 hypothetical protein IV79_GL001134 [Pediococcus claussenii]